MAWFERCVRVDEQTQISNKVHAFYGAMGGKEPRPGLQCLWPPGNSTSGGSINSSSC
jgi:hypothetical protein